MCVQCARSKVVDKDARWLVSGHRFVLITVPSRHACASNHVTHGGVLRHGGSRWSIIRERRRRRILNRHWFETVPVYILPLYEVPYLVQQAHSVSNRWRFNIWAPTTAALRNSYIKWTKLTSNHKIYIVSTAFLRVPFRMRTYNRSSYLWSLEVVLCYHCSSAVLYSILLIVRELRGSYFR